MLACVLLAAEPRPVLGDQIGQMEVLVPKFVRRRGLADWSAGKSARGYDRIEERRIEVGGGGAGVPSSPRLRCWSPIAAVAMSVAIALVAAPLDLDVLAALVAIALVVVVAVADLTLGTGVPSSRCRRSRAVVAVDLVVAKPCCSRGGRRVRGAGVFAVAGVPSSPRWRCCSPSSCSRPRWWWRWSPSWWSPIAACSRWCR